MSDFLQPSRDLQMFSSGPRSSYRSTRTTGHVHHDVIGQFSSLAFHSSLQYRCPHRLWRRSWSRHEQGSLASMGVIYSGIFQPQYLNIEISPPTRLFFTQEVIGFATLRNRGNLPTSESLNRNHVPAMTYHHSHYRNAQACHTSYHSFCQFSARNH